MKRVLVTGGRNYADANRVTRELDLLHNHFGIAVVIHGAALGADRLAARWANLRDVPEIACPADWPKHGRAAGPIRNAAMLAFPGGRGTEDMCRRALAAGITLIQVCAA